MEIKELNKSNSKQKVAEDFNTDMLKPPFIACISAPRGSGKSNLILNLLSRKDMLKNVFDKQDIFIMSPNLDVNNDYENIKAHKINNFSNDLILQIINKQKALIKRYGQLQVKPLLIVLDDCLGESKFATLNSSCETLAVKGRHLLISVIIVSQSLRRISRTIRLNTDYFIIFKPKNETEYSAILDEFFNKSDHKKILMNLKDIYKEPYISLLIDLKTNDDDRKYRLNFSKLINFENI